MKYYVLILLLAWPFNLHAQAPTNPPIQTIYGTLQFNTPFYDLENHWVVAVKNQQTNKYIFGMAYLDMQAGFTFHAEGSFSVTSDGHVFRDSLDNLYNHKIMLVRIGPATKLLCAIPDAMLADLRVKRIPDWLAMYHPANEDKNSVAYKVIYGRHLNSAREVTKALVYLEDAYKTEPHAAGLEFELSYAYNVLTQYDKAINVLKAAITHAPDNPLFYSELGFSYLQLKDNENTIKTYVKGINLSKQRNDKVSRMGMTTNLSLLYDQLQQYDKAESLINEYIADTPNSVPLYILLASTYVKANDVDNAIKSFTKAIEIAGPQDMETKAKVAWSIALLYRDRQKNTDQYATWGKKAKEWAPVNGQVAKALRDVNF